MSSLSTAGVTTVIVSDMEHLTSSSHVAIGSIMFEAKPKLDLKRKVITFGIYALVYTGTSNRMNLRAVPAIALRQSNSAGGHYFMSIHSGKRIYGYNWDELPIDNYVIERVESLAEEQEEVTMHDGIPSFKWAHKREVEDEWHKDQGNMSAIVPEAPPIIEHIDDNEYIQIEAEEEQNVFINDDEVDHDDNEGENDEGLLIIPEDNIVSDDEIFIEDEEDTACGVNTTAPQTNTAEEVIVAGVDDAPVLNKRPRRANAGAAVERLQIDFHGKGYQAKQEYNLVMNGVKDGSNVEDSDIKRYINLACDVMSTQMSAKRGIKRFGARAIAALVEEFTQLNKGAVPGKPVVVPTDFNSLTDAKKRKALRAINLIKERWNGDIKGRSCVDGSKQHRYSKQDESISSPTVALESLLATLLIDAYADRNVGTYDVPELTHKQV